MRNANPAKKRYMDYLEKSGKFPKEPEEDEMAHMSHGGMVDENYDDDMGDADEYDSSGEPHTDHDMEDEHPMEFMSRGGRVRKMSAGGMVSHPMFARALRKAM